MFDSLVQGFQDATLKLKGQARLSETNILPALDAVKRSLLDADVDLGVVKEFLHNVQGKALGTVVRTKTSEGALKVSAGDHFVQLCHEELVELLDSGPAEIKRNPKGPTVIMLVGLQGAGKTTHAAKLAQLFKTKHKMRPLLVGADVYRPAAREQLRILAAKADIPFFSLDVPDAVDIAQKGLEHARAEWLDLVIVDTAGRLAIDEQLMGELERMKSLLQPQNVVLVIDSMIGQDAVRTASAFDMRLNLSGVMLTKLDGDTRGGAALSVKKVTGKGILFLGTGEALDKIEEFRAEGLASRILGMGDVLGLMDDFSKVVSEEDALKSSQKMLQGEFGFDDFLSALQTIQKMGPFKDILAKTPLMGQVPAGELSKIDDREIHRLGAIVQSMTNQERSKPELLLPKSPSARSRIARIARGSSRTDKDVKDLVERFMQMRQMMQMFTGGFGGGAGGGFLSKIPGLGGLGNLANMAKMMKNMGGGAGMAGMMGGLGGGFPGMDGAFTPPTMQQIAEINRLKKKKKEEARLKQKKRK